MNDGDSLHRGAPPSVRRLATLAVLVGALGCLLLALAGGVLLVRGHVAAKVARALAAHPDRMQVREARWLPGQPTRFRIRLHLDRTDGQRIGPSVALELLDAAGGPLRLGMHQIRFTWAHTPGTAITATTVTLDGTCRRALTGPTSIQVYFRSPGALRPDWWEGALPVSWRTPSRLRSLLPGGPISLPAPPTPVPGNAGRP